MQDCLYIPSYLFLKLFYTRNLFAKLLLIYVLIEDLVQLLNIYDLFFSKNNKLSFSLIVFYLFFDIKQKNLAHK
jgi:hypothetical protein